MNECEFKMLAEIQIKNSFVKITEIQIFFFSKIPYTGYFFLSFCDIQSHAGNKSEGGKSLKKKSLAIILFKKFIISFPARIHLKKNVFPDDYLSKSPASFGF